MKNSKKLITSKESLSESDLSSQKDEDKITKPYVHRILNIQPDFNNILVNLAFTKYGIIHEACKYFGWQVTQEKKEGNWDLCWTDIPIQTDTLIRMHFHQKINYIPGMQELARKNLLGYKLNSMKRLHPGQYNFFPLTWMLPDMYGQFRRYAILHKKKGQVYIAKPQHLCQGKGIFLTDRVQDIENGRHYVIQQYITNPFLIDHLKFDLRIYILIVSTQPLKIYIYEEGLARFATQKYNLPNKNNIGSNYTHLTNYAINKKNPNFIFNKSGQDMNVGHKRSLSAAFNIIKKMGVDINLLKQKINDVIIKTIIPVVPILSHKYRCSQPEDYTGNMCFHVLGFDILIDDNANPIVIEVNHTPSFSGDTPLDKKIKFGLIKDSLNIMNINLKTKEQLYAKSKQYNNQRLQSGIRPTLNKTVRNQQMQKAQIERNQYQDANKGGFTLIYPILDNQQLCQKYKMLLQAAQNLKNTQNPKSQNHISLDLMQNKNKIKPQTTKKTHKSTIHETMAYSLNVGNNLSQRNQINFQAYKMKPKSHFSVIKRSQSKLWNENENKQLEKQRSKKMEILKSSLRKNSVNLNFDIDFTQQNPKFSSRKGGIANLSPISNKRKRGTFISPKVFDPSSCELKRQSEDYKELEINLILK